MRFPLFMVPLLIAGALAGCVVPENMEVLREELGYASVDPVELVVRARATTLEPRVHEPVELTAVVQGSLAGEYVVTWDLGDGSEATETVVQHAWDRPGTYEVTVNAIGPGEVVASDELLLTVTDNRPPTPAILIENRDRLVEGVPVAFSAEPTTDADGDVLTFRWELDGAEAGTGARVERTFDAGLHHAKLIVSDGLLEVAAFESFGVSLPIEASASLSLTDDVASTGVPITEGASELLIDLTHSTLLGLDDVTVHLFDPSGAEVATAATEPELASATATETLVVDASGLAPGTYTLVARLTRGISSDVSIEGVLTYSPIAAA